MGVEWSGEGVICPMPHQLVASGEGRSPAGPVKLAEDEDDRGH